VTFDFDRVELAEVSRHFGRRRALARVSLTARAGDIVGVIGPNGAGKSTLIGILATLVSPSSGEARYGGQSGRDLGGALRRRIGLVAHELLLYPELYGLDARRVVDAAIDRAGLRERADDPVAGFSRGMRQRLALERALLHGPRLALFDEPFTGLDDQAVGLVTARLRLLAASGTIVVMATHDLEVADGLVTRVALFRGGKLLLDEPAGAGLRSRYRELIRQG